MWLEWSDWPANVNRARGTCLWSRRFRRTHFSKLNHLWNRSVVQKWLGSIQFVINVRINIWHLLYFVSFLFSSLLICVFISCHRSVSWCQQSFCGLKLTFDVSVDDLVFVEVGQTSEQLLRVVYDHDFLKGSVLVKQMRHWAPWWQNKTKDYTRRSERNGKGVDVDVPSYLPSTPRRDCNCSFRKLHPSCGWCWGDWGGPSSGSPPAEPPPPPPAQTTCCARRSPMSQITKSKKNIKKIKNNDFKQENLTLTF